MTLPAPRHFAGWLPCPDPTPHAGHDWTYVDPATGIGCDAHCDGATAAEPEAPCCADKLCPCRATRETQ